MSMIGRTLGQFECTALIGKGGMGEVYQAKDLKLGRDVAIKVLPEEFAKDADRVARFQREAKLLASLNHPNIAAIHGLEEFDGTHFLVLELIEGDTLADRIKSGPIPVEESLKLALQIAEALEAAHEKGVIHRDLKPANIKVTPDGKVKVLDFGLAKAFAGDSEDINLSNSPTLSLAATQQGIILGTAAYMSPEQASGEATDKRTDIWAFGVVLFEMLTGRSLFEGNNVSQTLASVIKSEPEWRSLPLNLHPRIRLLLERCLNKEPKNRYSGISDARVDIQQVLTDPSGIFAQSVSTTKPRKKLRLGIPWLAATLALGAIIAGIAVWYLKPTEPRLVTRFPLEADGIGPNHGLALSPDGSRLVFAATLDGVQQLFLHARNQMESVLIKNTEGAMHPFFSPDGEWVGFFTENELKKVSLSGGPAVKLCDTGTRNGASWGPDDSIVFASSTSQGLMKVSASGGEPQPLTTPEKGEGFHRWPEFLPDGKSVLFTIYRGEYNWQVAVISLQTNDYHTLVDGGDAHFAASDHLIFAREASLWAASFDRKQLKLTGEAVPVLEGVQTNGGGWAHYALASDGSLVYLPGSAGSYRSLVLVNREGEEELLSAEADNYDDPKISPDGTRVALEVDSGANQDIWVWDSIRESRTRLTFDETTDARPIWTTDGKRIVFSSDRDGNFAISWKAADATGKIEQLASAQDRVLIPSSFSSDGKTLLTLELGNTGSDIGVLSMEGDRERKTLLQEKYDELDPQISPDGRWMAYTSNESGQEEVYVRPFPEVDTERWIVSTKGGSRPLWSPDGSELFYLSGDSVMAVSVETEPTFKPETPETLFVTTTDYFGGYDIHPDGKRFLMMKFAHAAPGDESADGSLPKINIVLNWFEELKQQVPSD